ncbi:MAG: DNA alkylation repair protein [Actinomycetota bacterium]
MAHLGVRTPVRRRLVRSGFSFTDGSPDEVLNDWDALWWRADCAEILFSVLDHYREDLRRRLPDGFWDRARRWVDRVDNWAHADDLARVYSFVVEAAFADVRPDLDRWNAAEDGWERRISIVSLVHYSGRDAVFLPPEVMLPYLEAGVEDDRAIVQNAVGWVLRELSRHHPEATVDLLSRRGSGLTPAAWRRAVERLDPEVAASLPRPTGSRRR